MFYLLLVLFTIALGLQLWEYYYINLTGILVLDETWDQAKKTLVWVTMVFFALNALAYKMPVFGTSKNQIVNGFLACSVLTIFYYTVSHLLLPYILFAQLGRLDLFLNP
jgi:uncharacterized membrane protein